MMQKASIQIKSTFPGRSFCPGISVFVWLLFFCHFSQAQTDNNWTFAEDKGLNFSTDPAALFGTNGSPSSIAATISDHTGKLMFYFDGYVIRDSNHQMVPGSDSLDLRINWSTAGGFRQLQRICFFWKNSFSDNSYYLIYLSDTANFYWPTHPKLKYAEIQIIDGQPQLVRKNVYLTELYYGITDFDIIPVNSMDLQVVYRRNPQHQIRANQFPVIDSLVFVALKMSPNSLLHTGTDIQINTLKSFDNQGSTMPDLKVSPDGNYICESIHYQSQFRTESKYILHKLDINKRVTASKLIYSHEGARMNTLVNIDFTSTSNFILCHFSNLLASNDGTKDSIYRYNIATNLLEFSGLIESKSYLSKLAPDGKVYYLASQQFTTEFRQLYAFGNLNNDATKITLEDLAFIGIKNSKSWAALPLQVPESGYAEFIADDLFCKDSGFFINKSSSDFNRYLWIIGNDTIWTSLKESFKYKFARSGTYTVRLYAFRPDSGFKFVSRNVTVILPLRSNYTTNSLQGCQYIEFDYQDVSLMDTFNMATGVTWNWKNTEVDTLLYGNGDYTYTYEVDGDYFMTLIVNNGFCADTFTSSSSIKILPAPKPGIKLSSEEGCTPFKTTVSQLYTNLVDSICLDISGFRFSSDGSAIDLEIPEHGNFSIVQILYGPTGCVTTDTAEVLVHEGFRIQDSIRLVQVDVRNGTEYVSWLKNPRAIQYSLESYVDKSWREVSRLSDTFFISTTNSHLNPGSYRIIGFDSCMKPLLGNSMHAIILNGKSNKNESMHLRWDSHKSAEPIFSLYALGQTGFEEVYNGKDHFYIDYSFFQESIPQRVYFVETYTDQNKDWRCRGYTDTFSYSPIVWIPNAFSPDGDGLNDQFAPYLYGVMDGSYQIDIFDRWGQRVFRSYDPSVLWNGTYQGNDLPSGVYVYRIHLITDLPDENNQHIFNYSGTIQLIR